MTGRTIPAVLALLTALAVRAFPQVGVNGIDWQVSRHAGKQRLPFEKVESLQLSAGGTFADRLRALVTLHNFSQSPAEGLILRYALTLRLLKDGEPADKAFWGVPFFVEEVRVSRIAPAAELQAKVIRFELQNQLARLRDSGFRPVAVKLQIMVSPRRGDDPSNIMSESVLDIVRP